MQDSPGPVIDDQPPGERVLSPPIEAGEPLDPDAEGRLAPAEAFQTLANEIRVAILIELFTAERSGDPPIPFSDLQEAVGSDSSAGFAYHLRQLNDHFVSREADGYVLTPAGRRVAEAIAAGTFTDPSQAS